MGEALAARSAGKPVPAGKIHLTLAFLGSVDDDSRGAVAAASAIRGEPIDAGARSVRVVPARSRRLGGAVGRRPGALAALQANAREARFARRGFALEETAFAAHATLVRRVSRIIARGPAAADRMASRPRFTLVAVDGTERYEVLESWGLK